MPFLIFFLISFCGAVTINGKFTGEPEVFCLLNNNLTSIKLKLIDTTNSSKTVTVGLKNYTGVLKQDSGSGEVEIEIKNLIEDTKYYHAFILGTKGDEYNLSTDAYDIGKCPSERLAEAANMDTVDLNAMFLILGIISAILFLHPLIFFTFK